MANTLLSPTIITREALKYFHQEALFIGSINRQYDKEFGNSGASPSGKIGPSLAIRMPNRFTVASGATMQLQDVAEETQTLTVATQKHVAFSFPMTDLALTIDEFGPRYLKPAMAQLAATVEADAISMYKDVYNFVDADGAVPQFVNYLQAAQKLNENLAFDDGDRKVMMCETHNTKLVDSLKGLFNPQAAIGNQYRRGVVGKDTAGFNDWMHTTLFPLHTTGTAAKTTSYTVSGAGQSGASVTVTGGTTTFLKGDLVTFAGCNAVHPETKVSTGSLQQFVITADSGASAATLAISPSIVLTGAKQNVSAAPTDTGAVVKLGAGASELLTQSLCYHKDAFTFVTADLPNPSKFGAWGDTQVIDNISMSIARQFDITNYRVPCRIDILYGFKTIRAQMAVRLHADG